LRIFYRLGQFARDLGPGDAMAETIAVGVSVAVVVLMLVWLALSCRWTAVPPNGGRGTWLPAISDEEFVARCSPGTDPDIALRVRRIIAEFSGVDYERVHPGMNFIDDLD
jgi:hypothetical protein